MTYYVTTAIPYVNAEPHLGHCLEYVQTDVLARHHRLRGQDVRFLSGTDDHAMKNVTAAREAGEDVAAFVAHNGQRFADLMLNGKFFRRYELLSDVTAPAGEYETASRLRTFLPAKGVEIRPADVAELELLLLPKTPMKVFAN